jgi:plasmid stability protein
MKTTLNIDERVMARLKAEAARQGRTMSDLVETALRRLLEPEERRISLRPLPKFRGGRELVDVSDREALYRAMDEG